MSGSLGDQCSALSRHIVQSHEAYIAGMKAQAGLAEESLAMNVCTGNFSLSWICSPPVMLNGVSHPHQHRLLDSAQIVNVGQIKEDVASFLPTLQAALTEVEDLVQKYEGQTTKSVEEIGSVMDSALKKVFGPLDGNVAH